MPPERRQHRTKNEIALEEIDRVREAGVRFDVVLADAGYGQGMEFRRALSERGPMWAVGVPRHQKAYSTGVEVLYARPRPRGRPKELPRTNTGEGIFGPPDAHPVGVRPNSVAVYDFNGDGRLDLVTANPDGNSVSVLLQLP